MAEPRANCIAHSTATKQLGLRCVPSGFSGTSDRIREHLLELDYLKHENHPFYRTLFTDLLNIGDDLRALTHALVARDEDHCDNNYNIAIRLKTSEPLLACLDSCEAFRLSASQLFTPLASALEKASGRIETDIAQ